MRARLLEALTRNRAHTAPEHPDARLRGREYPLPPAAVWDAVVAVAARMPRWRVIKVKPERREVRAEAHTRLCRFTDDVVIVVEPRGSSHARVDLRSASRIGRADFGTNARRIARFLQILDRHIGGAALAEGGAGPSIRDPNG
jgi:uncharacterized protein (DUF1499 family)